MFDFSFVTEHMGPSVWRGGCPWDRCAGWTCTLSVQMDRLVCSCLLQPRWRTHASTSRTDKHLGGRRFQRVFAKRRSLLGCSSKIRTWSIANTSWWMNWGGRHVCVKMPSYYRSNRTNRWSRLKVTLISFWLSITGSALFVMAGSTISIPMLLFGEHDRAALLWLTRWRITLLFCSSVYYFPFLPANLHPCTQWGIPTCVIWCNQKNCLHIFIHCRVQQLEVIISLSSFFFFAFFCWYTPWEFSGHENNVFHVWLPLWLFISEWGLSLVCCQRSQQKRWEKHTKHLAGIRGQTAMVSRAPQSVGFLKVRCGWVPYGLTQCYVTLNPHHLPAGPGV